MRGCPQVSKPRPPIIEGYVHMSSRVSQRCRYLRLHMLAKGFAQIPLRPLKFIWICLAINGCTPPMYSFDASDFAFIGGNSGFSVDNTLKSEFPTNGIDPKYQVQSVGRGLTVGTSLFTMKFLSANGTDGWFTVKIGFENKSDESILVRDVDFAHVMTHWFSAETVEHGYCDFARDQPQVLVPGKGQGVFVVSCAGSADSGLCRFTVSCPSRKTSGEYSFKLSRLRYDSIPGTGAYSGK